VSGVAGGANGGTGISATVGNDSSWIGSTCCGTSKIETEGARYTSTGGGVKTAIGNCLGQSNGCACSGDNNEAGITLSTRLVSVELKTVAVSGESNTGSTNKLVRTRASSTDNWRSESGAASHDNGSTS